jgi:hypothetical protein
MTLLYRVGDEIVIETSPETWDIVRRLIESCDWTCRLHTQLELANFANAIRSHLQHLDKPEPVVSVSNDDLI